MKAEVYILGLFTFKDEDQENIVFTNDELKTINKNIEESLGINRKSTKSKWVTYHLYEQKQKMSDFNTASCTLLDAEMGYYHHRVIFRFFFEGKNLHSEIRDIRKKLETFAEDTIHKSIIDPNQNFKFNDCYFYQLFYVHEGMLPHKKEDPVFSDDTTTMAFDITEPRKVLPFGKKYKIRISIPSTIIYSKSNISHDFLKSMINSIYQYCLYEKKANINDNNKSSEIDEKQLVLLWNHIIDTMGGRTLDKNIAKISQTNYILAFVAFLVGLFAIDFDKITSKWSFVTSNTQNIIHTIFSIFHI